MCDGAERCRLGCLSARIGVDFGVEDEQVYILARSDDVVQSAVTDVISPAVAADDPDRLCNQVVGNGEKPFGRVLGAVLENCFKLLDSYPLCFYAGLIGLVGISVSTSTLKK